MTTQERIDTNKKIQKGLELAYSKLVADTRAKNCELVVLRDNKIVTIKP